MSDNDLKVIIKAKELMKHTYLLTSNSNRYPKKYRHSLVDRMQITSMDILKTLRKANRINNVANKVLRCETITEAIGCCDDLLDHIELSMELKLINDKSTAYWSKMVSDVKHMAIAWRTSERKQK